MVLRGSYAQHCEERTENYGISKSEEDKGIDENLKQRSPVLYSLQMLR